MDTFSVDVNSPCTNNKLKWSLDYELGYGRVLGPNQVLYATRIYYTRQPSKTIIK